MTFKQRCQLFGVKFAALGLVYREDGRRTSLQDALLILKWARIGKVRNVMPNVWVCE